tara:strand:+ start:3096 stop:3950 length:855 start_codon:yes stop_codon:yes gene_type:complete
MSSSFRRPTDFGILEFMYLYLFSAYGGMKHRAKFSNLETFCMFLGYARSGTSLVGALLDAHPNVILAHELDVFKYLQAGFTRDQIFHLLMENSKGHAQRGRKATGYSYEIKNQWQGRHETLRVIGDKKGGKSSLRLLENPELLEILRTTVRLPLKIFHVVRNPYDNIATKYCRRLQRGPVTLRQVIEQHFSQCQTVSDARCQLSEEEYLEIHHEAMIDNPVQWLHVVCEFLGIKCSADYAEQCAQIVFRSPHKTRNDIEWSPEDIEIVCRKMKPFSFLNGYSYD